MEKAKARFDLTAEELERLLVQKEGENMKETAMQARSPGGVAGKELWGKAVAKGGLLLKGKNPGMSVSIFLLGVRLSGFVDLFCKRRSNGKEDDVRARMSAASDVFRKAGP